MKWLDDVLPDSEQWSGYQKSLIGLKDTIKETIVIGNFICYIVFYNRIMLMFYRS